ncbi:MAG: hypothetical protein ACKVOQ_09595 [Cyclobacteriaceae bacterium]
MTVKEANKKPFKSSTSRWLLLAFAFFISVPVLSQNTKGDKPARSLPKLIFKSKPKKTKPVKSITRDISGRRLRTKNKSSAARAVERAPAPYFGRKKRGDQAGKPVGGSIVIRSSTARAARNNVYPNRGSFVNNPSRKPRTTQKSFSNNGALARAARLGSSPPPFSRKRRMAPRSASRSFITRGRKNVYWGKFSKGEKAFTKDITGRPLRAKNYRTPSPGLIPQGDVYRGRKRSGDKPYQGTSKSKFATASKPTERAWRGDVSGHPIGKNSSKKRIETAGQKFYPRKLSISGKRQQRAGRPLPGSGYQSRTRSSESKPGLNPVPVRQPGAGASRIQKFVGNLKTRRPEKGGGSISGRSRNNGNQPIAVRTPGSGAARAGIFSGNIKARRPEKGGGSISGRSLNNRNQPIAVRVPASGAARVGTFSGNIKARKPEKGGGSISGRLKNNGGNAIPVRTPLGSAARAGTYSGNLKATRIFNYRDQGEEFTGFLKARKPVKGGGSVSGKLWNNKGNAIDVRTPLSRDAKAANYSGRIKHNYGYFRSPHSAKKALKKKEPTDNLFAVGGLPIKVKRDYKFVQNPKAAKKSLRKKEPDDDVFAVEGLQVKVKRDYRFIQNPKSSKASLKKREPTDQAFAVTGLQVKVKQGKYQRNPESKKGALMGIGPNSATVKASEYQGRMKMIGSYTHNPSSAKAAANTIRPNSAFAKGNSFIGRTRLTKNYRHNPKSDKDALKVIAPSRAYARINNYQGNLKMSKPHGSKLHPDAKFAHDHNDNVKSERTILTNVKLWWSKLFKKNDTQPTAVKEKVRRPRYDKKERELWKDLYD